MDLVGFTKHFVIVHDCFMIQNRLGGAILPGFRFFTGYTGGHRVCAQCHCWEKVTIPEVSMLTISILHFPI